MNVTVLTTGFWPTYKVRCIAANACGAEGLVVQGWAGLLAVCAVR